MVKTGVWPLHLSIPIIILAALFYVVADTRLICPLPWLQNITEAKQLEKGPDQSYEIKPSSTVYAESPLSVKPVVTWTKVAGAVYYEIEFLRDLPENPNGTELSIHRITSSREVFTNGYNADLTDFNSNRIYWRVRALDLNGNPLGVFSDAQRIFVDLAKHVLLKPQITVTFNENGMATPLYPVYSWIPIPGVVTYQVELLSQPPENPNGTEPSVYRMRSKDVVGFDCYDDEPRNVPGVYYWRVRGLDAAGNTVGGFSDVGRFVVDLGKGRYAATFGDSITHGGGAISYSPADWEYDYQTYLQFPVMNLGKSGDTSETMVERFEQDVLPYHPQYLLILGGTNSLRGGTPASQVIKELTAIRDKCLAEGIRPIFLTLPPINPEAISQAFQEETVANWRQEFDAVNSFIKRQQYYIDLAPYLADAERELPAQYAIDGLHLDIEGKKRMAEIINTNWERVTR
ncbi:MAG: GDSL-type esterase/lipase family protein [Negativicutes bacterium]|nr:GDSL-type esterase/lipase family protein [Negativicutes bacterium]